MKVAPHRRMLQELDRNYVAVFLSEKGKQSQACAGHKHALLTASPTILPDLFKITKKYGFKFLHGYPDGYETHMVFVKDD